MCTLQGVGAQAWCTKHACLGVRTSGRTWPSLHIALGVRAPEHAPLGAPTHLGERCPQHMLSWVHCLWCMLPWDYAHQGTLPQACARLGMHGPGACDMAARPWARTTLSMIPVVFASLSACYLWCTVHPQSLPVLASACAGCPMRGMGLCCLPV